MRIREELVDGLFVERLNRFAALVEAEGRERLAHVPNSGRMRELLQPGARVLLARRGGLRKTEFDLVMVHHRSILVSVDARRPPALLVEALREGRLPELGRWSAFHREVPFGESRLDLLIEGPDGRCYVETKSANLVRDGVAFFPDAPTTRGTRHLEELRRAAEAGYRAAAVFVVQREDAISLRPYEEADPGFAAALRSVSPHVQLLAYRCRVGRGEIAIAERIPVEL